MGKIGTEGGIDGEDREALRVCDEGAVHGHSVLRRSAERVLSAVDQACAPKP